MDEQAELIDMDRDARELEEIAAEIAAAVKELDDIDTKTSDLLELVAGQADGG